MIFVDFIVVSTMRGSMLKGEGRVEIRRLAGSGAEGLFEGMIEPHIY